jgi:hypothetical protein
LRPALLSSAWIEHNRISGLIQIKANRQLSASVMCVSATEALMRKIAVASLAAMLVFATSANAGTVEDNPDADAKVPVTIDNFVRAATDIEFAKYATLAGGVNRFFHFRDPTPIDNQPTIRMNRDTLYSAAVVDISEGATLTLPEVGDRYMTAMIVDQDHYIKDVFAPAAPTCSTRSATTRPMSSSS